MEYLIQVSIRYYLIKRLHNFFDRFDRDRDGFLDLEDMKLMMETLGAPQTHLSLKKMIQEVDTDGDSKISFNEVSHFFFRLLSSPLPVMLRLQSQSHHQHPPTQSLIHIHQRKSYLCICISSLSILKASSYTWYPYTDIWRLSDSKRYATLHVYTLHATTYINLKYNNT